MKKINFTKEEKKQIHNSFAVVVDDLRELFKLAQTKVVEIELPYYTQLYKDYYYLRISNHQIELTDIIRWKKHVIETRTPFGKSILRANTRLAFEICKSYEEIRRKVECEINEGINIKKNGLKELNQVKKNYERESEVHVTLPPTMNQHEIVITKEDGRNVGILDFGKNIVKIVTDNEIKIVNKPEHKVKRR